MGFVVFWALEMRGWLRFVNGVGGWRLYLCGRREKVPGS